MKYLLFTLILFGFAACNFTGFKTQKPKKYAGTGPKFEITKNLNGKMLSEGVLFGPNGSVVERFVAEMEGTWIGSLGVLSENFTYSNGTKQSREWQLTLLDDGKLTATAADVIGTATGEVSGATLMLKYKIQLTDAAGGYILDVIDWIYLTENGVMINKSEMRKFGIKVAELVGNIRPAK